MNYKDKEALKRILTNLKLAKDTSKRLDCICGGKNTLSVSNVSGKLIYQCFKLSCPIKGKAYKDLTIEELRKAPLVVKTPTTLKLKDTIGWEPIQTQTKCIQYLDENNCYEAWLDRPKDFFYDKVKDRIVFVSYISPDELDFAQGRSLCNAKPKWLHYIRSPHNYYLRYCIEEGVVRPLYIVEDAASACSLARIGFAVALCGTSWNIKALVANMKWIGANDIIVSLDRDAQMKAQDLKRDLEGFGNYTSVRVVNLSNDAKYLSVDQLHKELNHA